MERAQPRASAFSLALFGASTFFFWASLYVYVPVLPLYAQQAGASLTMVGLIVGAYGVTQLIVRLPLGMWSDRLGRRLPFIAGGMLAAGLGALGLGLAHDPWLLFLSRALTGVGASAWVAFAVLFSSYFPPRQAVRAMSLITFVNGISQVVSTSVGGWIAQTYGWSAPFYVGVGLAVLGYICTLGLREEARPVASALTPRRVLAIMTVPLLVAVSVNAILSQYASYVTTYAFTPIYAEQLGATRTEQGPLVTAMLLAYSLAMLVTSWLADRVGDRATVAWGMLLAAVSVAAVPFIESLGLLAADQALLGFGRGLAYPVLMGLSIRAVPQEQRATAMGFFQAVYAIGMFVGPSAGGPIADNFGLPAVFYSTAVVCLLAVALALATIPGRKA